MRSNRLISLAGAAQGHLILPSQKDRFLTYINIGINTSSTSWNAIVYQSPSSNLDTTSENQHVLGCINPYNNSLDLSNNRIQMKDIRIYILNQDAGALSFHVVYDLTSSLKGLHVVD